MTCFDIRGLIEEIGNIASMQLKIKEIRYFTYIDESVPSTIYTDSNRVRQVILNLVENAIKYNKARGSVSVSVMREDDHLKIEVADTGKGITPDKLSSIFYLEEPTSIAHNRMSISLPIAYKLTKLLGKELKVVTTSGLGSRFSFYIVLHPVPNTELSPFPMKSPAEYNLEEEYQTAPFIQYPLPSIEVKMLKSEAEKADYKHLKIGKRVETSSEIRTRKFPRELQRQSSFTPHGTREGEVTEKDSFKSRRLTHNDDNFSDKCHSIFEPRIKPRYKMSAFKFEALAHDNPVKSQDAVVQPIANSNQDNPTKSEDTKLSSAEKQSANHLSVRKNAKVKATASDIATERKPRKTQQNENTAFTNKIRSSLLGFHEQEIKNVIYDPRNNLGSTDNKRRYAGSVCCNFNQRVNNITNR